MQTHPPRRETFKAKSRIKPAPASPAINLATSRYSVLFKATAAQRIQAIRRGVPAKVVARLVNDMGITNERLLKTLRFPLSTTKRRIAEDAHLPQELSERLVGLQKLIGQVEVMVAESGSPEGFNAAHWLAAWLENPAPALDGVRPAEFMDTMEGQEMVSGLLAKMQSGAYA